MENISNQELGSLDLSIIQVRCPNCYKCYSVDPSEITEARPRFQCSDCSEQFWLPFPESLGVKDLIGFSVGEVSSNLNIEPQQGLESLGPICPKCSSANNLGSKECSNCGVIFSKYDSDQIDAQFPRVSQTIKALWKNLMLNYSDEFIHQNFVNEALKAKALDYAARKYKNILEINPIDEICKKQLDRIHLLKSAQFPEVSKKIYNTKKRPIFAIVFLLSSILIVFGFMAPGLRNLVGIGASVLFLAVGLRYYNRHLI